MQKRLSSMPINIERPQSALLRGVNITEYKDNVINPDPIVLQETDFLLEEFLSPTKLKALTGANDLYSVDNLEMVVDTSETSLGNFGIYLPNLKQLKLNSSFVPRIRDLGTSLGHLRVLWLSRSGLSDLDGIPSLTNLQELYLAYNEIQDISPCSMLDNLKALDLEGNLIDDIHQIQFLSLCSSLKSLTLEGNPICIKPNPETQPNAKYNYRREVSKILPNLKLLDDEVVVKKEKPKEEINFEEDRNNLNLNTQCPFEDDWQLINKCLEEGVGPAEEKLAINQCHRPGTGSSHGTSPLPNLRPLSAMRPLSSCRPGSALQRRPMSGNRLGTASSGIAANLPRPHTDPVNDIINDASELTIGPTLYGNPLRGLMARKKNKNSDDVENKTNSSNENKRKNNDNKKEKSINNEKENSELYKELKSWRKEHEKKMEERKKYFEPQVLRIDDYAEPVISDNDEIEDDYIEDDINYNVDEDLASNNNNKYKNNYADEDEDDVELKNNSKKYDKFNKKSQNFDYNNIRINSAETMKIPILNNDSTPSSRLNTSDTGYASLSSPISTNLKTPSSTTNIRQPVIISAANNQHVPKLGSPLSLTSKTSLQQLKSNLTPLSGIKFAKN